MHLTDALTDSVSLIIYPIVLDWGMTTSINDGIRSICMHAPPLLYDNCFSKWRVQPPAAQLVA